MPDVGWFLIGVLLSPWLTIACVEVAGWWERRPLTHAQQVTLRRVDDELRRMYRGDA